MIVEVRPVTCPPSCLIVYHCGSSLGWSPQFYFRVLQDGSSWGPRLAVYGDMGNDNAQSLSRLQKETQMEMYDAILHVADFAYDMDEVCVLFTLHIHYYYISWARLLVSGIVKV
ncbi:hypothetical protein GDO81_021458 [Engystomops pustulosus]|uniref:Uncharacterized protein n=1 Tax=Engystomops pustulosus TaxID=76066 RepID=A0AAV6YTG8_ENGPU|nr:hypothetical protein GDO81_021458 [Engystomops pustulosus]